MPDPQLSEEIIMDALGAIASPVSAERLENGAVLAIVDCFDRRINRDPFITAVTNACMLHDSLGRLHFANAMMLMWKQEKLSIEELEKAVKRLTERAEDSRNRLIKEMELVVQCPLEADKRH